MKERLIAFLKTYLLFVCIFVVQKPLFMLCYHSLYADASWKDWLRGTAFRSTCRWQDT